MAESYTVLARRYRSQTFDELVGQEAVAQTLKNAVASGRLGHAFLFTGTRGVGKTSAARILAKAINCPQVKDGNPCGICEACKAIARGDDLDVIEIDGASNNSVDQIRELRQNASVRPARSPFKIYIIDEVHMVTTAAFNALLKTLEEPPAHVKFIFATTDIHKVPATIISRVQRYDFKNIATSKIALHLKEVCQQEGMTVDDTALQRLARLGNGSMRDALSIMDRVMSLGNKQITDALLDELLGKPAALAMLDVVTALAAGDPAATLTKTDELLTQGLSPEQICGELIQLFRDMMVAQVCGAGSELIESPADLRPAINDAAGKFDAAALVHLIALCEQTQRSLRSSTMGKVLLEALMVRLALADQFSSIRDLLARLPAGGAAPRALGTAPDQKKNDLISPTVPTPAPRSSLRPSLTSVAAPNPPAPAPGEAPTSTPQNAQLEDAINAYTPTAETEPAGDLWQAVRTQLITNQNSSLEMVLGGKVTIGHQQDGQIELIAPQSLQASCSPTATAKVTEALKVVLQLPAVTVQWRFIESAPTARPALAPRRPGTPTPPPSATRIDPEVMQQIKAQPVIKELMDQIGVSITSVEPLHADPVEAEATASSPPPTNQNSLPGV
jgi:DNA polymerase-3 subunit gamma/tau